jgi:hypothetical protein
MTSKTFASLTLAGVACLGLATSAHAGQGVPGSLLVFPAFDNTRGDLNLITVTNTSDDQVAGSTDVEFVYINGDDANPATNCQEFNRVRTLTPNDEISVLAKFDNPNMKKGYVYVFARSHTTGKAIKFDHLIGTELTIEGTTLQSYALNPWAFTAGAALNQGDATDLNNNGLRDLDGNEYEKAPDRLDVPHFIGTDGPQLVDEKLILINLTGGQAFTAVVDFLVYNDNEEVFSAQFKFNCWIKIALQNISAVFTNPFLVTTNNNPNEIAGPPPGTVNEVGWYRMNGDVSFSTAAQFADPAILSAHLEHIGGLFGGAFLPFTEGTQGNGSLLSHSLLGT